MKEAEPEPSGDRGEDSSPACFNVCSGDSSSRSPPTAAAGSTHVEYRTRWMTSSVGNNHTVVTPNPSSPPPHASQVLLPVSSCSNEGFSCCRGSGWGFLQSSWRQSGWQRAPGDSRAWRFYSPRFWWSGRGFFTFRTPATRGRGRRSSLGWYTPDLFLSSGNRNSANVTYFLGLCANFLFGCSPSHHP